MISLRTLGALQLSGPDGEVLTGRRKHLALLTYLVRRAPQPVSRGELATLLWEDRGEERAKHSLRQALVDLRRVIGEPLDVGADAATLARGAVDLDVDRFDDDFASGRLDDAVRRWGGDFLPGLDDLGGEEYRLWVERERAALRRKLAMALEALMARAEGGAASAEAIRWGEQWVELLPLDTRGHLRLIGALRAEGRATEALDRHSALVSRLREELEEEPASELLRLGEELAEEAREAQARAPRSAALFTPDLVGRADPFRELAAAWQSVRAGAGAVVLIEGEAGIGKTRLADEFVRRAQSRESLCVLRARAYEAERDVAWRAARELLSGLRHAQGLLGAPEWALARLSQLVPAIREQFPRLPKAPAEDHDLDDAVARVLADVAAEMPVIAYLDDLPFVDGPSRRLVLALARRPPPGVLLLLTARTEDWGHIDGVGELRRLAALRTVYLRPLELPEVEALLASAVELRPEDRTALATRLHAESGGNPFFAIALLTALVEEGVVARDPSGVWRIAAALAERQLPLPAGAREVVARRVARLGDGARQAADVAALVGVPFGVRILSRLADLSPVAAEAAVEELILRRFVRQCGPSAGQYEFAHELVRRYVLQAIPVADREALSRRVAAVLDSGEPLDETTRAALERQRAQAVSPVGSAPRRRRALAVAALVAAAAVVALVYLRRPRALPASPTTVAVLPFSVRSDSLADLAEGMMDLLSTKLDGAGTLRSADPRVVLGVLAQQEGGPLEPRRARRVSERAGAGLYILGEVVDVGGRLHLRASLYDARRDATPAAQAAVEGRADELFELVDRLATELLASQSAGPGLRVARLAALTTTSLPALKDFLRGEAAFRAGRYESAVEAYRRAIAQDTTFALAYYRLSTAAEWLTLPELARQSAEQALRHAARLSEHDRLLLQASVASRRGTAAEAERLYRAIVGSYPNDVDAWFQLGEVLFHYGPFEGRSAREAREPFERVLRYEADHAAALVHLTRIAALEERRAALDSLAARVLRLNPDGERDLEVRALRAFGLPDTAEQRQVLAQAAEASDAALGLAIWSVAAYAPLSPGAERLARVITAPRRSPDVRAMGHLWLASAALMRGRWRAAQAELAAAQSLSPATAMEHRALFAALPWLPVADTTLAAMREALVRWDASAVPATVTSGAAFSTHNGVHPHLRAYLLGLLSARLGDRPAAARHAGEVARMAGPAAAPELSRALARGIRAEVARVAGRHAESFEALAHGPVPAFSEVKNSSPFFSEAYTRYQRAEALLALGRDREALRWLGSFGEYSITDNVFLAPAHLRQAEAYERLGDRARAAAHYARLVALWRESDPELAPVTAEAARRLERLRR